MPENAFLERHLYTKRDDSGNPDLSVEEGFGVVESAASPVICKIVSRSLAGHCPCLTEAEREALIRFIIYQQRRDPGNRHLVEETLDNRIAEIPDVFERAVGRPATMEERALIETSEFRKQAKQNAFPSFAGELPADDVMEIYSLCPIHYGAIRDIRKSFVIGNHVRAFNWFPVHRQVAFKLVVESGPDELIEFKDMAQVRRINEQTVRVSTTFAGHSERLVRSLAGCG